MRIEKKKHHKTKIAVITTCLVLLAIVAGGIFWYNKTQRSNTSDTDTSQPQTKEQRAAEAQQNASDKQEFLDQNKNTDQNSGGSSTNNSPGSSPSNNTSPSSISLSANYKDDTLVVTTNLSTITSGTCNLILTNGSRVITKSAEVIYAPEHSTCAGFSISKQELSTGSWQIALNVHQNSKTIASKTINYEISRL